MSKKSIVCQLSTSFFTFKDIERMKEIAIRDGCDPETAKLTFGQRFDLEETPFQIYAIAQKQGGK